MFNLRENIVIDIFTEGAVTNVEFNDEILRTFQKVIIGRLRDLNGQEELQKELKEFSNINSLQHSSSNLIGSIIEYNFLDIMSLDFSSFSNANFRDLLDFIEKELDKYISKYTINYTAEELLIKILTFASVLSKLTFSLYAEDSESINPNENFADVEFLLKIIDISNIDDIRGLTGEMKGALECAVDSILLKKVKFSNEITKKQVDLFKILTLFNAKNTLYQIKEIIPILGNDRKDFKLDKDRGIILPRKILESFSSYIDITKDKKVRIENDLTTHIFDIFYNSLGFQPNNIFKYAAQEEGKRAFRIYDNYLTIADKELLPLDIMLNQKLSYQGVNNLMNTFTLNKEDFYEQKDNSNDKKMKKSNHMGSANSRLFRSPIIRLETKILVPTYTWLESLLYLSSRILNRDIFSDMVTDTWNELIKKTYDEYDLPKMKLYLHEKNINAQINVDLAQMKDLKKDIESIKKMPHEIDLLYFEENSLVIMDLKNYGIQNNFTDVRKVVANINRQKAKMNKLRQFILERKNVFEKILKSEFKEVIVGILTVNPTIYPYIQKDESLVNVISIQDFKEKFEK
ncbi:hypothetical protein [Lysinibacillus sp. JNUCC 51]|uniref:hypothetical protein n=1 Tax=Lysinibacillus sp. JNUCC-51 TaxID=2792479 RepID=UPI00193744A7|nr:hypothetical protein JNUCC51_24145 [Lysinibacillus sp. JNUCC-51]